MRAEDARAQSTLVRVAVPMPLRTGLDYRCQQPVSCGCRVMVPVGQRHIAGLVIAVLTQSAVPENRLRNVLAVLDEKPMVSERLLKQLLWASDYYQHPIGEVLKAALPGLLGGSAPPPRPPPRVVRLTPVGHQLMQSIAGKTPKDLQALPPALRRAPARLALMQRIYQAPQMRLAETVARQYTPRFAELMRGLVENGWAEAGSSESGDARALHASVDARAEESAQSDDWDARHAAPPQLNAQQLRVVTEVCTAMNRFQGFMLHGVTGSGKTEVYIAIVQHVLSAGKQALVLTPEISLTPQLVARFEKYLGARVGVLHSRLTRTQRRNTWEQVRNGRLPVVLGARSAVFAPVPQLGVIIVDEEHDISYKQSDGFRYHARDMAVLRAHTENIPVVLGSATPSLESVLNVQLGRYRELSLPVRATATKLPHVRLLDTRTLPVTDGFTLPLMQALAQRLARGEQSLLYINRRGFALVLFCTSCGWKAQCDACDANMVLHLKKQALVCHHCGVHRVSPSACPVCNADALKRAGHGTERIEQNLARIFPKAVIERLDSDSVTVRGELERKLASVQSGITNIIIGTRMLGKGHDFPNLSLVGVMDVDHGFYSVDFRALEYQVQQLMQVAGRAGRGGVRGEVLIQTAFPEHPYLKMVAEHDFKRFAHSALVERRAAHFPPFSRFVLIRAEAGCLDDALDFLHWIKSRAVRYLGRCARDAQSSEVAHDDHGGSKSGEAEKIGDAEKSSIRLMDPVSSPMERRQGRYRAQLLVQGERQNPRSLQTFLSVWLSDFESDARSRKVRWSVDVDPMDMF